MPNPSEVSPAMTAEERIRRWWPEFRVEKSGSKWFVYKDMFSFSQHRIGSGTSKAAALTDAASRLPASPVAEGESQK